MDPLNFQNNVYTDRTLFPPSADVKFINTEYYFNKIYLFFQRTFGGGGGNGGSSNGIETAGFNSMVNGAESGPRTIDLIAGFAIDILYVLLVILIVVIAYVVVRMFEIRKKEEGYLKHEITEYSHRMKEIERKEEESDLSRTGKPKNPRWESVLKNVYSENEANWKLAIIDADEELLSLMNDMGFKGDGLGEKLKSADRDKFHSLSAAWEVHTIRNRIAHEGSAYMLSQREAKRVVALYEQIFKEFGRV